MSIGAVMAALQTARDAWRLYWAARRDLSLLDREADTQGRPQPPRSPATGEREASTQVYGMAELDGYSAFLD